MRRSVSTKLAASLVVFLAALASSGCCKPSVRVDVEPCPVMSKEMLEHLKTGDDPADVYVADEIIPYCDGIKAMKNDE